MKIINTALLVIELLICLTLSLGYKISFGNGGMDIVYFGLFFAGVFIHLVWTIRATKKGGAFTLPVIIFSLLIIFILLKASFLRGSEFHWDGDIFVNHGRLKPSEGNSITYSVIADIDKKGPVYKINLPDPQKKYLTTIWVSDPECTGCNDCVIDSGKLLIPDTLKRFVNDPIDRNIIFLEGKSPYEIQGEPYVRYQLKGQVIGVKEGRVVFYVSEWRRR